MEGIPTRAYGCQRMVAPLRRVLVKHPAPADFAGWQGCGWRAFPDPSRLASGHEAFCAGVDVAVYRGDEISRKGDGGPTCLTRPILRG